MIWYGLWEFNLHKKFNSSNTVTLLVSALNILTANINTEIVGGTEAEGVRAR
jgi:hypothetical protein